METVRIHSDWIKLGALLKLAGTVGTGGEAKMMILDGLVQVNGEVCTQRGKKIYPGDTVQIEDTCISVTKEE